jgi:hypothetical protein
MSAAEELFTDTFGRYQKNWTVIISLRQFVDATRPFAELALGAQHADWLELIATDPEYKKIFGKDDKPVSQELREFMQNQITQGVMTSAHAAVDAASIVFAQSILDDSAWSYLKVCAMVDPAAWEDLIDAKKIDIKTMREKKYEDIRKELIQAKLDQLGRESLLVKIDLLFKLCTPPKGYSPMNNYEYDRTRLERIDGERHGMIHENGFGTPLPTVPEDLEYMSKTAWFLMGLVNQKHGLRLDMQRMMNLPTATP